MRDSGSEGQRAGERARQIKGKEEREGERTEVTVVAINRLSSNVFTNIDDMYPSILSSSNSFIPSILYSMRLLDGSVILLGLCKITYYICSDSGHTKPKNL